MNTEPRIDCRKIKSPLALARTAMANAQEALPLYSSKFSRHDFTQHQMFALLALRRRLKTDYRGLEATLREWAELRDALGLKRVPDHSTIQRAARRLRDREGADGTKLRLAPLRAAIVGKGVEGNSPPEAAPWQDPSRGGEGPGPAEPTAPSRLRFG